MKKMPGYTDLWLSPVTGLRHADVELLFPDLQQWYCREGNKQGRPQESPVLIDIKLDLMRLRRRALTLPYGQLFIGNFENIATPTQQINVNNLPILGAAIFPDPTGLLPNIPIPNPDWNPLSPLDWVMSGPILGQIFIGSSSAPYTAWQTSISSSYALAQAKIAQLLKRFDVSGFIVQTRTVNYGWPNPAMALIPAPLKALYGLQDSYSFTDAQALDELGGDGLVWVNEEGVLSVAFLTYKKIWRGDENNRPVESDDLSNLEETVEEIEGDVTELEEQITEIQDEISILEEEIAELQNWQAAAEAQLEEILTEIAELQADLAALESELALLQAAVESLQDWQVAVEAQLEEILAELGVLQTEISALEGDIAAIQTEIAVLEGEVATLAADIAAIDAGLAALGGISAAQGFFSFLSGLFGSGGGGGVPPTYAANITLTGESVGSGTLNAPIDTTVNWTFMWNFFNGDYDLEWV